MRHGTDEQRVLFYGGIERNGFEQAGLGAAAFGKHLPDELVVGVLAGLVRQQVEIEAEDGE